MFKKYVFYILVSMLLIGCDPGHELVFVNNTESEVFVDISVQTDSIDNCKVVMNYIDRFTIKELDSLIVIKPKSLYKVSFGIGTWSNEEIDEFSRYIEEIKIESERKTVIYNSKKQIEKLLKGNRESSIGYVKINIEIN